MTSSSDAGVHAQPASGLRLAELLAALSLETDLGMGHPPEEAMRTCLFATGLAHHLGMADADVSDCFWTALLMHVGCTAFAHEQAALFGGDEIAVNALASSTDFGNPREALSFLIELGRPRPAAQRARILFVGMTAGDRFGRQVATATCEVAAGMAPRLGLGENVGRALHELFERWDGTGAPQRLAGEAIALPARLAQLAAQALISHRLGGIDAVVAMARRRAGTALDPRLADACCRHADELLADMDACDPLTAVVDAEPAPRRWIADSGIDGIARAFGDAVDLKTPFTLGHSAGVAALVEGAGRELGWMEPELARLRRAALLHDLGRVAVPNGIWEKAGPLTMGEWEQVRLHPYHSERILARSAALAGLAPLAGMHHERIDGSGYHRQVAGAAIPLPARVLGAADALQAMIEPRPYRPALTASTAALQLRAEARAGRLDARAVDAVLAAAGHRVRRPGRQGWPAGLTDREVAVLRLLARGVRNREIAARLFIAPKTVGHHVEHIYGKLGVTSRAAAALFAVQHDLLP
jgi:HD-GYP domain-containing protein (c-di-GMP phosphodiesterase class II)